MTNFRRFETDRLPRSIVAGLNSRSGVGDEVDKLDADRVLIVCSPGLRRHTRFVDALAAQLGSRVAGTFDGVKPHNPATSLDTGAAMARDCAAQVVISIGGGAVHDAAKAVALMATNACSILDLAVAGAPTPNSIPPEKASAPLPMITIPSTFSAAEMVGGGATTDTSNGSKRLFAHPGLVARAVILDGEVVASTPRDILAGSGLNALHHCVEALCSTRSSPVSDALALSAFGDLMATLPYLAPGADCGLDIYQRAIEAAAISGLTYANSSLGIGHAICHVLGGRYGISHGVANSVLVLNSMIFNKEWAVDPLARAARAAGAKVASPTEGADAAIAMVARLVEMLAVPRRLRDIGIPRAQVSEVARAALEDWVAHTNPRPIYLDDVQAMLESAW